MKTNIEQLRSDWLAEQNAGITGWDWSRLDGRVDHPKLPWNYQDIVRKHLRPELQLLDIGTGGGEVLLSIGHPYERTSVTEGWEPNYKLCLKRLVPLGVQVERWEEPPEPLPFADEAFDVVISRHDCYDAAEVWRVLKPGGVFVTQQVGGKNDELLIARLTKGFEHPCKAHTLENEITKFRENGFEIALADELVFPIFYRDVGAVVFTAAVLPWEFPGFSVESHFDCLLEMQDEIEIQGFIESREHRFIFAAVKPR